MDCSAAQAQTVNCTGTINVRAMAIPDTDISCNAVYGSSSAAPGATMGFTPSSASNPARKVQSGSTYVSFAGLVGGTYTLTPLVSSGYYLQAACWKKLLNAPLSGTGISQTLSEPADADTLTWDLGYTLGAPWTQVVGGDVYAAGSLKSPIPQAPVPNIFITNGSGGSPGVATYGVDYSFDGSGTTKGDAWVSSKNWLAHDTASPVDYYRLFYTRFGSAPTVVDYVSPGFPLSEPAPRAAPYYVTGDMTTQGDWTVGAGQKLIFLVDGNLTINGKITITGNGFAAFIARGNIVVDPTVGVPYSSSTPVVEGVYATSPTGTIHLGQSTHAGTERFVGRGTFIGGNVALERDLDAIGHNNDASASLFIWDPQIFMAMPDAMKNVPISWQEVAP